MLPGAEPIGLPSPAWLLQSLLVLTMGLHVIPMTLTVGGALAGLWCEVAGLSGKSGKYRWLARRLWSTLPTVTAFTITLGVAPLLFVQLLYGKFFYPASILTGWSWFAVIPLLLLGYGALYLMAMSDGAARWRPWAALAGALAFLAVGAIYVSTMSLTTAPAIWKGLYAQTQAGTHWYFQAARGLHVLLGAVSMAGGLIALYGHQIPDQVLSRFARRLGLVWAAAGVLLQVPVSLWFLSTFTPAAAAAVQSWLLVAAAGAGALGVGALLYAQYRPAMAFPAWLGLGSFAAAGLFLAVQRHLVRQALLAPHITEADWKVSPQWDVFVIFGVTLVAAIGLIGYLGLRFLRESNAQRRATSRSAS